MMERSALRFVMVVIFVLLVPKVSIAEGRLATGQERPAELGTSVLPGEEGVLARLLDFLREVLGNPVDDGAGADGYRQKDLENRMGIDPNGNS
jgi:hypothetical protein